METTQLKQYVDFLGKQLFWQNSLVDMLLQKDVFTHEDVYNIYDEEEEGVCVTQEVYMWYAYMDESEWTRKRLDKANIPYIYNDYGLWIGRTDFGSAWDMYFLPELAQALYGEEAKKT